MGHCDVTIASGWPMCLWRHNRPSAVNFEIISAPRSGKMWIYVSKGTGIMQMIGAPNSLNLNCKVRAMKEAPGPSVSEEIADIFTNHNIDIVLALLCSLWIPTMFIVLGLYSRIKILSSAIRRTEKLPNCQTPPWVPLAWSRWGETKHQHFNHEYATWYLCTREIRGRMNAAERRFYMTLSWMVLSCPASCSWRPLHWITRHNHLTSRQFHSFVPWCRARRIQTQRTRLIQSENSAP